MRYKDCDSYKPLRTPERKPVWKNMCAHTEAVMPSAQSAYHTHMALPLENGMTSPSYHTGKRGDYSPDHLTGFFTHPSSNYPSVCSGSSSADIGHIKSIPRDITMPQKAKLAYACPYQRFSLTSSTFPLLIILYTVSPKHYVFYTLWCTVNDFSCILFLG